MPPLLENSVEEWATGRLREIEGLLNADGLTIISPLLGGLEHRVKIALEARVERREALFVILDTGGGDVEVVERMVRDLRYHYNEIKFIVPDKAMSAGTVLAMSGDEIWMDYHSCLGPIDPQIARDGRLEPALSYLTQYERLIRKSQQQTLSTAEVVLLSKLDLAELHRYELAKNLTINLLTTWLARYKFKDWTVTESRGKLVTQKMKEDRAEEIATKLNDQDRWLTHSRGIDMTTLRQDLDLRIDDLSDEPELQRAVWNYFWFLCQHMQDKQLVSFVHTPEFF